MDDIQRTQLKMLEFVSETLDLHNAIWSGNAVCVSLKAELDAAIAGMNGSYIAQIAPTSWDAKRTARTALEAATWTMMNGLNALATMTNNESLLADTNVSTWKLRRMPELKLIGAASQALNLVGQQSISLTPYGIEATAPNDLQAKKDAFTALLGKPAAAKKLKAESTMALAAFQKNAQAACNKLDRLIPSFESASPQFVWTYKESRKVIKQGHRKRALQVRITNAAGKPIALAMISIPELKVKRRSTAKGQVYIQHLRPGSHTMRVDAEGYAMKEVPVVIDANERTVVEVVLGNGE